VGKRWRRVEWEEGNSNKRKKRRETKTTRSGEKERDEV